MSESGKIYDLFLEGEFERTYDFFGQTCLVMNVDETSMEETRRVIEKRLEEIDNEQAYFDFFTDYPKHFVELFVEDWEIEDEKFLFRGRVKVFYNIQRVTFEIV